MIIFALNRLYSFKVDSTLQNELLKVALAVLSWLMLILAYFFIIREPFFSRLVIGYTLFFTIILVSLGRSIIRIVESILLNKNIGKRRVLIIGANNITQTLYNHFKKDKRFTVVGVLANTKKPSTATYRILGSLKELANIVKFKKVDELIQTKSDLNEAEAIDILDFCREKHLEYSFVPDIINIHQNNIEVYPVSGIPLINLKPTPLEGWGKVIKRLFDIAVSSILLIVLSPIFLIIAIAIKLDSKGTILFKYLDDGSRAMRVGQHKKLFKFHKFRSMYPNTHDQRYTKLAHLNARKGTPMVKIKNDPRVTKVGRFLRKTSLDELPQLWNVLTGSMSLVGPRAHLPEEVAAYNKHHKFALTIKPGITGLAQISGRSDLDFEEESRLDRYYIENWSIWADVKILIKTFFVVVRGNGAE